MSININIQNVNYSCAPIIKEGFNGVKETISWSCSEKPIEKFVNVSYTCPKISGATSYTTGTNYSTICNWSGVTQDQCNSINGIMNGNKCQKTANVSCPSGKERISDNENLNIPLNTGMDNKCN
jgi:hypothetical protein